MGSGASTPRVKPTLYMHPFSAPCRAVMMTAYAINLELELKKMDLMKEQQKEEWFLKINPDHCVPTLVDGSLRLWESRAIMQYIVNMYGADSSLYPRDPIKRAEVDRMLQYDQGTLYQNVSPFVYPQIFKSTPADPEKAAEVEKVLDYLEKTLSRQPYVAAAHLTIADLTMTANLANLEVVGWNFDKWPKVVIWREAIRKEPWYAKANHGLKEFMKKPATST